MATCIHGCGNALSPRSHLDECPACRSRFYYWRKKTPAEIITRRAKLDIYSSTLDTHFNTKGKQNQKLVPQPTAKVVSAKVIELRRFRRRA
jgi:hypothetical protein